MELHDKLKEAQVAEKVAQQNYDDALYALEVEGGSDAAFHSAQTELQAAIDERERLEHAIEVAGRKARERQAQSVVDDQAARDATVREAGEVLLRRALAIESSLDALQRDIAALEQAARAIRVAGKRTHDNRDRWNPLNDEKLRTLIHSEARLRLPELLGKLPWEQAQKYKSLSTVLRNAHLEFLFNRTDDDVVRATEFMTLEQFNELVDGKVA